MYQLTTTYKRLATALLTLGVLLTIVGGRFAAAQSGNTTNITAVNVVTTSATNASLSFSYSSSIPAAELRYVVSYGSTVNYGTDTTAASFDNTTTNTQAVTLLGLTSGTTYHFTVKLFNVTNNEQVATSADRTFTTASTGGNSSQLIIERIRMDCVDTSCDIYFSTTQPATVEIRWDTTSQTSFSSYANGTTEGSAGSTFRSIHFPQANQAPLEPCTATRCIEYHYRLNAVGANPNTGTFATGDLSFRTSANGSDHVFATGQCSDGRTPATTVDIGSCLGSLYCSASGTLVSDCTKCGFLCQSGKTCRTGSPDAFCEADRPLNGSPIQCNPANCYDPRGNFISPAPAACVSTWPRCNANTILKVRNDRGCNLWLSCATSLQTDGTQSGPGENLCLNLGACNSLNANGQCNHYLPQGQCNNDPLRFCNNDTDCQGGGTCNNPDPDQPTKSLQNVSYQTPAEVSKIANLSGNIVAGLDWTEQGGANVIQGMLPWQLMRQIGGDAQIKNGDLEFRAPEVTPWNSVPEGVTPPESLQVDFEDKDNGSNHVLTVEPVTQTTVALRCSNNVNQSCTVANQASNCATPAPAGTCGDQSIPVTFSGAATNSFNASPSEYYYAEARIRGVGGSPVVRVQFGFNGYSQFSISGTNTFVDVPTTAAWQRVTLGPLKGMSGITKLAFVCADQASCGKFQIDDVVVKPILQVNTNPSYIAPTCRLYPKNDSPSCDYADTNGVVYKGWKGYCLEHDSQTGTCLSWWPVDIIKGESSIFGSEKAAGYQDRAPLYLCAQTADKNAGDDFGYNQPYVVAERGPANDNPACNPYGSACINRSVFDGTGSHTIGQCSDTPSSGYCTVTPTGKTAGILEEDIASATWVPSGGETNHIPTITFNNTITFQATSPTNVDGTQFTGTFDNEGRINWKMYREVAADAIYWRYVSSYPGAVEGLNGNGISVYLKFNLTTHEFIQYGLEETDSTGSGPAETLGAAYRVKFTLKQICSKIVQVVDQNGTAAAFAARVGSSVYKVPDLNYGLSTDLSPFGAALQPQTGSDDPTTWPLLSTEQPDYTQIAAPGQARAGSPYACNGPCTDVICTVNNSSCLVSPTNPVLDPSKVRTCQQGDADKDGTPDGECIGVITSAASSKGMQSFSSTLSTGDTYFAQERIKRLFAQSFGVWSNLRCTASSSTNAGGVCIVNSDCGNGACSVRSSRYLQIANQSVGWRPPTQICPANPAFQANVCTSTAQQCTASLAASGTSGPGNINVNDASQDAALKQTAMRAALLNCGLAPKDSNPLPTNAGAVITGNPVNGGKIACSGVNAECPGGGTTGYEQGTTALFTTFTLSNPCSYSAATGYTCTGRCSSNSNYINASKPTVAPQSKYLRPSYVAGSQADYCAIPPEVSNVKFTTGTATTSTVTGGSGSVGIKFNTNADQEQVPLSAIRIDWGDSQDEFAFPYAPRNDTTKPHIFSHTYVVNRGDTAHCTTTNGRTTCQFAIKIQVQDSWNWCNDANATASCHTNPSGWVDTGLRVIVQP